MLDRYVENGIILVDKPVGTSSFGVVARIRHILTKHYGHKIKVGHTGTLDPFASGLMILVVGKECKNAALYSKLDKTYLAEAILGKQSSTGDPEGDIQKVSIRKPNLVEIEDVLKDFNGIIQQTPPIYSAIKIGGQRAYKLARSGKKVEMPSRTVTIKSIDLIDYNYPVLKIRASVSSGTYIRSLVEDIGSSLGVGAYCHSLRRESIGEWSVGQANLISDLEYQVNAPK